MEYSPNLFISHVHEREPIEKIFGGDAFLKTNLESDLTNLLSATFNTEQSDFFTASAANW